MCQFLNAFKASLLASVLTCTLLFLSCNNEAKITFEDELISTDKNAVIEINIPKATGNDLVVVKKINKTLQQFVTFALDEDVNSQEKTIQQAVKEFEEEFKNFNKQIPEQLSEELPVWEVLIDGEITYQADNLVSIGMNSSVNTGAAKNRSQFEFYNFDLTTGKRLHIPDLIENEPEFKKLVKKYFDKELLTTFEDASAIKSVITDATFSLPKTIGFNDDGIIVLFDEFGTFSEETIEFTIPFEKAEDYLKY